VGLDVHEPPWITAGNRAPHEAGMVHSVEPGVYIEGAFGVRLEDLVVVEAEGARRLNCAPLDPRPPRLRS
jgi:Xaa-Pro aminopeptidase